MRSDRHWRDHAIMPLSVWFARRYFSRRKLRNALIIVAVTLSVTMLVSSNIATQSISNQVVTTTNTIGDDIDLAIQKVTGEPFNQSLVNVVMSEPFIMTHGGIVAPRLTGKCIMSGNMPPTVASVVGVDPVAEDRFGSSNTSFYQLSVSNTSMISTDELARAYGITLGSSIKLGLTLANGTQRYSVFNVTSIAHVEKKGYTSALIINISAAQWLFATPNEISIIVVKLSSAQSAVGGRDALRESLSPYPEMDVVAPKEQMISDTFRLVYGFSIGLNAVAAISLMASVILTANCLLMAADERRKEMGVLRAVGASRSSLFKIFVLEAAIQGSIGGGLGVVLGVFSSTAMAFIVSTIVGYQPAYLVITTQVMLYGFITGVAVAIIGSLYPAFVASVTPAARAMRLRMSAVSESRRSMILALVGLSFVLVGVYGALNAASWVVEIGSVLLMILGSVSIVSGLVRQVVRTIGLAAKPLLRANHTVTVRNAGRNRRRTSLTIGMVSIGLTFVIFIGSIQGSLTYGLNDFLYRQLGADVMISPKNTPINITNIEGLGSVEGVSHFSYCEFYVRIIGPSGSSVTGNNVTAIAGIDTDTFPLVSSIDLRPPGPTDVDRVMNMLSANNNTIVLTTKIAAALGVTVGDNVTVPRPDALGFVNFTVIALSFGSGFVKYGTITLDTTSLVSFKSLRNYFNIPDAVGPIPAMSNTEGLILVKIARGEKPNDVAERIMSSGQLGSPSNLNILTSESIVAAFRTSLAEIVALFQMLLAVSLIIALLGLSTTMLMSVMERRREMGILRAIGMSKSETLRAVLGESLILGLAGLLMGFINALLLTWIFLTAVQYYGFYLPFIFPAWEVLSAAILTIMISMISGAYPARLTSKLKIVDAIKYE